MADRSNHRLVFSSGVGEMCPECGRPRSGCRCGRTKANAAASVPARIVAKLRMERAGRGGKTVTVVDGLPANETFLQDLCAELKRSCGAGGTVKNGTVELQGEHRDRLRPLLAKKGYAVKG